MENAYTNKKTIVLFIIFLSTLTRHIIDEKDPVTPLALQGNLLGLLLVPDQVPEESRNWSKLAGESLCQPHKKAVLFQQEGTQFDSSPLFHTMLMHRPIAFQKETPAVVMDWGGLQYRTD